MEIEELPDLKIGWDRVFERQDIPLLDYIWEVANKFLPSFEDTDIGMIAAESTAPNIFANRYFENKLDISFKDKYLKSIEVIEILNSFEIDVSKFWYLSLFIKDVVLDKCVDAIPAETSNERIQELIVRIEEMELSSGKNAELIFKLEGKQSFTIADKPTIGEIGLTLAVYKKLMESQRLNNRQLDLNKILNEKVTIDKTPMFALFAKMMKYFLDPYKAKPPYPKSLDKMLLISKMIYILGLSNDRRFNEEYETDENGNIATVEKNVYKKRNFLKNLIRRYENYKYPTIGNIYMG